MIVTIETTKTKRRFKLAVNRVYQGVFGLQRILERVAMLCAAHQTEDSEDLPRVYTTAMDALDFAAGAVERLGNADGAQALAQRLADPAQAEQDYQALAAEVRSSAEMRHAWDHASRIFGGVRGCQSRASVLGAIAAGLAAAYSLLGEDLAPEDLRGLYEEAEPLVALLLSAQSAFAATPRLSAPGGTA